MLFRSPASQISKSNGLAFKLGLFTESKIIFDGAQTESSLFFKDQSSSVRVSTTTQRLSIPAKRHALCSIDSNSIRCSEFNSRGTWFSNSKASHRELMVCHFLQ